MPQSSNSRRVLFRLVLFTLAGWALWALGRDSAKPGATVADEATEATRVTPTRSGFSKRRLATSLAYATLFFAGAAVMAGAGTETVNLVDGSGTTVESTDTTTDQSATTEETSSEPTATETDSATPPAEPSSETSTDQSSDDTSGGDGSVDSGQTTDPADTDDSSDDGAAPASGGEDGSSTGSDGSENDGSAAGGSNDGSGNDGAGQPDPQPDPPAAGPGSQSHAGDSVDHSANQSSPVDVDAAHDAAVAAEAAGSWGTFWLQRTLPDPTPPASRLNPRFARSLVAVAKAHDVEWSLVLGILRARGHRSPTPASRPGLVALSTHLHRLHAGRNAWQAVLGLEGRTAFADRAIALARYNRAVGLWALVHGLVAAKSELQNRVLHDRRIDIYAGGRSDIASGRVDVRVLALLRYMAEAHGQVTVSCLISGHRLYARPGVVSAHIYGEAVDISALGGVSIYGNQQPGGLTEKAVRNILLLPVELRPKQVISLLGLGGPSFALADHYDHIHVGF
jgi:hypothetical protein